jgi:hypothetical protein
MVFKIKTDFLSGFYSVLCGTVMLLLISGAAHAQVDSACDPDYMAALEARAYLEGQREIAHNKDIIQKPDSVLEYSCFHGFLEELAQDAFTMFSETQDWGLILPATSMDTALTNLVGNALQNYIDTNFRHGYVNERGGTGLNEGIVPPANVNGGAWPGVVCDHMIDAWNLERGLHFQQEVDWDQYRTFEYYAGTDPRERPIDDGVTRWPVDPRADPAFQRAYNVGGGGSTLPYQAPNDGEYVNAGGFYDYDLVQTFLLLLDPGACTAPPIPTGVTVERSNGDTYDEHVCSNPGCYFGGMAGGCN